MKYAPCSGRGLPPHAVTCGGSCFTATFHLKRCIPFDRERCCIVSVALSLVGAAFLRLPYLVAASDRPIHALSGLSSRC